MRLEEIMLIREAVSTTALENGWTKEGQNKHFEETLIAMAIIEAIAKEIA